MSKTRYYDRDGAPIEKAKWEELSKDVSYREMRAFQNDRVRVAVRWLGKVVSPDNMDADYWPLYTLEVHNWVTDTSATAGGGYWAKDPNYTATTGHLADAEDAYEEFLLEWTDSTFEEDSKGKKVFVEAEDNQLAPPPEPDRNTPESTVSLGDDGVDGAW